MKQPTTPLRVIDGPWGYACVHQDAVFIPAVQATPEYPLRRVLAELFNDTGETRFIFSAILNPDDLRPRLRNIVREWDEYVEYMDDYSHCIEICYEVPMEEPPAVPAGATPPIAIRAESAHTSSSSSLKDQP